MHLRTDVLDTSASQGLMRSYSTPFIKRHSPTVISTMSPD